MTVEEVEERFKEEDEKPEEDRNYDFERTKKVNVTEWDWQ